MFHLSQTGRGKSTHKLLKSAKSNFFYTPHHFFFSQIINCKRQKLRMQHHHWQLLRCNLRSRWSLHSLWQEAWNRVEPQRQHVLSVPGSSRGPNRLTCQLPSSRIWLESRCCRRPFLASTENMLTVENCFCASVGGEKRENVWITYARHQHGAGGMENKDNMRKDF